MSELKSYTIEKFLGVNKTSTETLLQLGEAATMTNWIISDDYKLVKMFGYEHLFDTLGTHNINGQWHGSLNGNSHYVFACNGHIYEHNLTTHTNTDLGTVADVNPTTFFVSNNTLYIMDGTNFFSWSGTGSIASVTGYIPTVYTASPPTGGGTMLESINYINGAKIQKFSGDNSATVYQLLELNINSVDSVTVGGVTKTVTTDYTVDLTNGTVTFIVKPPTGVNNVVITWTKTVAGDRAMITNNRYYGGVYYARYWLFGNSNHLNTRFPSGVTMAGVSDPTYWPKYSDSDVGEYEITDIVTQYNKQLIFTNGDSEEASAWYSEEEDYVDGTTGAITALFPVYPMNSKVGNIAKGQTQIIMNNPFTVYKGIYQWVSTYVLNEKNVEWMSRRIQNDLDDLDLTTAITIDWNDKGQYWFCVGTKVCVYNYRIDAWYILELAHTPTCFCIVESEMYFGTTGGQIMKFDETVGTFDGTTIVASWEMGYTNFGIDWLTKFVKRLFISILPLTTTHVDIYVSTDKNAAYQLVDTVSYDLSSFETWDFSDFSFETNYSPQPFKAKLRAKKIDYFKLKILNDGTDGASVLSITLPVRMGGEIKNRS